MFHHRNNINTALTVLQDHGVKLVNISSDDIGSGNPKLTLALIWLIALSFNGQKLVNSQAVTGLEKNLLQWVRQYTEPHGLRMNDFRSSWCDGTAFLYVISATVPGIDVKRLLKLPPIVRLQQAFDLARTHLHIDQLLDPEDVHTTKPDKKSILMYVMSLYHATETRKANERNNNTADYSEMELLDETTKTAEVSTQKLMDMNFDDIPLAKSLEDLTKFPAPTIKTIVTSKLVTTHSPMETSPADDKGSDQSFLVRKSDTSESFSELSKSRPMSTATNASVEIGDYQLAVEEVLTLLLESEDILSRPIPTFNSLEEAKVQFQEHEQFMLKLSDHQRYVGSALEEGARLISESQFLGSAGLTMEEQHEIKQQMFLLNERWETLRVKALEVQSKIHSQLADVQLKKIEELRAFLTKTEDRISRYPELGPGPNELKKQLEDHRVLQEDLELQQHLVDSLSNLIVIVDDEAQNFNDLEDRLSALGERWSHVVKWTASRWEKLQELNLKWMKLTDNYRILLSWMDSRERDLKSMEAIEVNEVGDVYRRIRELRYCRMDLDVLTRHMNELEEIANSINTDTQCLTRIVENLENLNDRCEALKQIIEVQQTRIESMGFQFASNDSVERPGHWQNFQVKLEDYDGGRSMEILTDLDDVNDDKNPESNQSSPLLNKKRKMQKSEKVLDLEVKIIEMLNFIDHFENLCSDFDADNAGKSAQLMNRLDSLLKSKIDDYPTAREMLDECQNGGEFDLTAEERQLSSIGSKYDEFVFRLENMNQSLDTIRKKDKFYKSLTGLKLVLADSRDWFKQHGQAATNDELKTRLRDMESLSPEINDTKVLCRAHEDVIEWQRDFEQFTASWDDLKNAICKILEDRTGTTGSSEQIKCLIEFLDDLEDVKVINGTPKQMKSNLKFLNEMSEKLDHSDVFHDLQTRRNELVNFDEFEGRWTKMASELKSKVIKQSTIIENVNHFLKEHELIYKELNKLEKSMEGDLFTAGDKETLDKLSQKYESYGIEIKKIEIDIISVRNFCEIITTDGNNNYLLKVEEVSEKLTQLMDMYKELRTKLKEAKEKTDKFLARINGTELWLTELEKETPLLDVAVIANSNELFQIKSRFQNLKERCDTETVKFRELNDMGAEILLEVDDDEKPATRISYLARALTKLNARWSDVTHEVYEKTALLEWISGQLGEFHTLVVQENGYLDKLEQILRKSPENAADAEEICEELDDLENIIRNHSDERVEKIQEIGKELVDVQFMPASITNDVSLVVNRWHQLQHQVIIIP